MKASNKNKNHKSPGKGHIIYTTQEIKKFTDFFYRSNENQKTLQWDQHKKENHELEIIYPAKISKVMTFADKTAK